MRERLALEQAAVSLRTSTEHQSASSGTARLAISTQQLVGIERGGEHVGAPREEALPELGALVGGDVLDDVDRHRHVAVVVADRRRLDGGPALLAGVADAEAHDRLGVLLAAERAAPGERLERERLAALVDDLVAVHDGA